VNLDRLWAGAAGMLIFALVITFVLLVIRLAPPNDVVAIIATAGAILTPVVSALTISLILQPLQKSQNEMSAKLDVVHELTNSSNQALTAALSASQQTVEDLRVEAAKGKH
jgi:hypothetical protein